MRWKELRDGDVLAPGDVAGARDQKGREKTVSVNAEGLKMCVSPSVPVPADQLFGGEPDSEHQELQDRTSPA